MLPIYVTERKSLLLRVTAIAVLVCIMAVCVVPTAFARNTYLISDGDMTREYTTYTRDPALVLDQAGVELGEDDIYTTQPVDGIYEITVQRSQTITVLYCGEELEIISYGETVQQLLDRMGIPTGGEYEVSSDLSAETHDGLEITVDRITRTRQSYTVDVPYEVTYCYDPNLPEGEERTLVEGITGQQLRTVDVVYCNTREVSNTLVEETVIQEAENAIVLKGTGTGTEKTNAPAIGDGVIVTADGQVLTYGRSEHFVATAYTHTDAGCDMITATGTTVRIGTVAVDPTVIPYGTRMFIVCDGGYIYGLATAEDCGGAIKDRRLDLYMPTTEECFAFGVHNCTVYFLD